MAQSRAKFRKPEEVSIAMAETNSSQTAEPWLTGADMAKYGVELKRVLPYKASIRQLSAAEQLRIWYQKTTVYSVVMSRLDSCCSMLAIVSA